VGNPEFPIGTHLLWLRFLIVNNFAEEVIASEIFEESIDVETEAEPDDIIIVHMDIREPLSMLK